MHASFETRKSLSKSLQPTEKDIKIVFSDTASQRKVKEYLTQTFEEDKFTIELRKEHKQLKVWSASISDFKNNATHAIIFPSAFMNILDELNPDFNFSSFQICCRRQ